MTKEIDYSALVEQRIAEEAKNGLSLGQIIVLMINEFGNMSPKEKAGISQAIMGLRGEIR